MLSLACKEERKPAARRLTLQIGRGRETGTVKAQDWWACREVAGRGISGASSGYMPDIRKGTMKVGAGSALIEQERNLAKKGAQCAEEGGKQPLSRKAEENRRLHRRANACK